VETIAEHINQVTSSTQQLPVLMLQAGNNRKRLFSIWLLL